MDATLPFGLRSVPLISLALVNALIWGMQQSGVQCVFHYLDDFITVGAPKSGECERSMIMMHKVCQELGLPIAEEKDEGSATFIM